MSLKHRIKPVCLPDFEQTKCYIINLQNIDSQESNYALTLLDSDTIQRANKHLAFEDSQKKILVYACLNYCLSSLINQPYKDIKVLYTPTGKPYIAGNPIYFSVTHTKQYAALAFHSTSPIGIDIELVRNIPDLFEVADTIMHHKEKLFLMNCDDPLNYFFSTWCTKEAFLKAKDISFDNLKQHYFDMDNNCSTNHYIHKLYDNIIPDHKLAICTLK